MLVAEGVVHAAVAPAVVVQVGSTIIKSPGEARSIAVWMLPEAATCLGVLPPTVTVTASIDCLPLPAVIISSPQLAEELLYCVCCWMTQAGTGVGLQVAEAVMQVDVGPGTVTVIDGSLQPPLGMIALTPPMVTLDAVLQVGLPAVGDVHRVPKP